MWILKSLKKVPMVTEDPALQRLPNASVGWCASFLDSVQCGPHWERDITLAYRVIYSWKFMDCYHYVLFFREIFHRASDSEPSMLQQCGVSDGLGLGPPRAHVCLTDREYGR